MSQATARHQAAPPPSPQDPAAPHRSARRVHVRLPRTRDEVFAAMTVVLAVVAVLLTVAGAYDPGAVVAVACVLLGGSPQLVSETRFERWESVCATVVGAVVLAVCLAEGSGVFTTTAVMDP